MHFSEEEKKLSFGFKQKVKCSFSTCIRGGEKKTMFSLSKRNFWAFFAGIAKRKFSPGTPFFCPYKSSVSCFAKSRRHLAQINGSILLPV